MDIVDYRRALQTEIRPLPTQNLVPVEYAWRAFRAWLSLALAEAAAEELAFNIRLVTPGPADSGPRQLEIYLGRLTDSRPGAPWRTVDVRLYYRFLVQPDWLPWVPLWTSESVETAYGFVDPATMEHHIAAFVARVDRSGVWAATRMSPELNASFEVVVL